MEEWYKKAETMGPRFARYIKMPLLQRKTHPTKQMESWIAMMKEQTEYSRRQGQIPGASWTEQDFCTRAKRRDERKCDRQLSRPRQTLLDHYFDSGEGNGKNGRKGRRKDTSCQDPSGTVEYN